jgi:hypothetical protein
LQDRGLAVAVLPDNHCPFSIAGAVAGEIDYSLIKAPNVSQFQ